ncbi:MAG: hypothetical protein IPL61_00270 [Myxococcales bacterium]|nr:hypothetical protein [Myxococcales bacterium]
MRQVARRAIGGAALVALVVIAVLLLRSRSDARSAPSPAPAADPALVTAPNKPAHPPAPGTPRTRVPSPEMPRDVDAVARVAYERAKAAGTPPGEAAFRAMIHAFIEYNAEFAKAQAAKEGITVAEVEELTYLGYLVMATQRLGEVEEIVGRTFTETERGQIAELMQKHNGGFKDAMHEAVARGASEDERRQLIAATEAAYKQDLYAATGLDDDTLDGLLAGDLAKPGAPLTTEIPADIEPRPYVADQPRPGGPPLTAAGERGAPPVRPLVRVVAGAESRPGSVRPAAPGPRDAVRSSAARPAQAGAPGARRPGQQAPAPGAGAARGSPPRARPGPAPSRRGAPAGGARPPPPPRPPRPTQRVARPACAQASTRLPPSSVSVTVIVART